MAEQTLNQELERLTRLYAALSQINQAIVRLPTREALLNRICHVLVHQAGFRMAWFGWHNPVTQTLDPIAVCGDDTGYLQRVSIYADDRPQGLGPSGRAFREVRRFIVNDVDRDPLTRLWLDDLHAAGFRGSAALPICLGRTPVGTLNVYSDASGWFQDREVDLLVEVASDVSFALANFTREDERQRLDAAVRSEKAFSDTMIDSMPGIVYYYDERRRLLRWNRNFAAVSGYSADELAAMGPLDFFAGGDRARVDARIRDVFTNGESSIEADFVTRDGRSIPYFFTGRRVVIDGRTGLIGVGVDISDRLDAERERREADRKYRELVELANSIILRWDAAGRVTFLNEFGQRFFGYREDEIVGRNVMGTIVPIVESSGRDLASLMARLRADPQSFERHVNENVTRSGQRVWIAWTNHIVRTAEGDVAEILSVGSDISAQRQTEEALRLSEERYRTTLEQTVSRRTEELQDALYRAEAADRTKSAFLATMSHELRTPLNSILGFTGIVLQELAGPLTGEQRKQLSMVRGSARHLLELINDVLDLSKIEAGQMRVLNEPFDLAASARAVVDAVSPLAERKHLPLAVTVTDDVRTISGDRRRVEQILLNLLNNAVKFTDQGRIDLRIDRVVDEGQAMARLRVVDTGVGISDADLATLFQPFRQLDSGLARQHDGTGLGLAICRRLAALMGGRISAVSSPGEGSTFTVFLPTERSLDS